VDKELLRVDEAAAVLSLGRSKTYQLMDAGELQTVKIGRAVRITAASVREYVSRQVNAQKSASAA
jgi:excisionase family DNA binding protein